MNSKNGNNVRSHEGKTKKERNNFNYDIESKTAIDDREFLIIQTHIMLLPLAEALAWLEVHGYKMEKTTYYDELKKISNKVDLRLMELAKKGLLEIHMKMIDTLVVCERELWNIYYRLAGNPYKQSQVMKIIIEMQPYLMSAYNKTRVVIEKQAEMRSNLFKD